MKHLTLSLFILHSSLFILSASSAVPCPWTVEMTRAQPATFEYYQGETIDFEATLTARGKPFEAPSNYSFFWQTNGMGNLYWEAPCTVPPPLSAAGAGTNILRATWLPSFDCGARVYKCFIGSPSNNYHTAFQLRLRPSPGAVPNTLPLPVPVIDFAKVRVLNPPWSGGGGGGVDTNAVRDIIREQLATNGIRSVDGAARPLPKYLHLYEANDSYPEAAAEYYRSRGNGKADGGCSSVRDGGFLYRNFDYPFDDRAEFIVRTVAAPATGAGTSRRFASVGVAQVGTNLTEQMVTSGKWSKWYKALPGATVDGINENGVACNINVVDGEPAWHTEPTDTPLHPLGAIRWILDNSTNAQHAAEYIAANIRFPAGWTQNFHYMIADEGATYIVENGYCIEAAWDTPPFPIMTNHSLTGLGQGTERYDILLGHGNITNVWYTNAYRRETNPPWVSDLREVLAYTNEIFNAWATHPKEYFRSQTFQTSQTSQTSKTSKTSQTFTWWQTVHTSVYDLTNRTLRIAVQETDDWYTFAVPGSGGVSPAQVREIASDVVAPIQSSVSTLTSSVSGLQSSKANKNPTMTSGTIVCVDENGDIANSGTDSMELAEIVQGFGTKADRVVGATSGNLAELDENGDLADSGIPSDSIPTNSHDKLTWDATQSISLNLVNVVKSWTDVIAMDPGNREHSLVQIGLAVDRKADRSELPQNYAAVSNAAMSARSMTDRSFTVGFGWLDLPAAIRDPAVVLAHNEWMWRGKDAYGFNVDGARTADGHGWASAEAATNATLVIFYLDGSDVYVHRGEIRDSFALEGMISATNPTFSNAVLSVATGISTNDWAVIASVADWASVIPGGVPTGAGTLGAVLAALAAAVLALKKKTSLLKSDGTAEDDFATNLMEKPVAKTALMIPLEAKTDSFAAEDGHAYAVTMTGTVTITMPTATEGKAAIFQARFSAAAQQSVEFSTTALVKFDGADCGIVKAGKDALLSAMWNGEAWDLVWKNEA